MSKTYTSHAKALEYLRNECFGRVLSYREVAAILSLYCGETVPKSEAWNAEHRKYRCPKRVLTALHNLELVEQTKRYRFFYEVEGETYHKIKNWLFVEGYDSFTEYMRVQEMPWNAMD